MAKKLTHLKKNSIFAIRQKCIADSSWLERQRKVHDDEEVVNIINDVADNCCPGTATADLIYRGDQELVLRL